MYHTLHNKELSNHPCKARAFVKPEKLWEINSELYSQGWGKGIHRVCATLTLGGDMGGDAVGQLVVGRTSLGCKMVEYCDIPQLCIDLELGKHIELRGTDVKRSDPDNARTVGCTSHYNGHKTRYEIGKSEHGADSGTGAAAGVKKLSRLCGDRSLRVDVNIRADSTRRVGMISLMVREACQTQWHFIYEDIQVSTENRSEVDTNVEQMPTFLNNFRHSEIPNKWQQNVKKLQSGPASAASGLQELLAGGASISRVGGDGRACAAGVRVTRGVRKAVRRVCVGARGATGCMREENACETGLCGRCGWVYNERGCDGGVRWACARETGEVAVGGGCATGVSARRMRAWIARTVRMREGCPRACVHDMFAWVTSGRATGGAKGLRARDRIRVAICAPTCASTFHYFFPLLTVSTKPYTPFVPTVAIMATRKTNGSQPAPSIKKALITPIKKPRPSRSKKLSA
ncbi:hypothetical protein C8R45DRAFT_937412 [Mycena sanguinolenta]|nr:hypothetical protein C8R45DRAFT_937412 [Mycena sanguinolenta]